MAYQYFYPMTIRRISYAVLNILKDIKCVKYDTSGNNIGDIPIPISFNQPEKSAQWLRQNFYINSVGEAQGQRSYLQVPRTALMFDAIAYDPDRVTGSNETREWLTQSLELYGEESVEIITDMAPTPYNFGYTWSIRSDSLNYLSQILEQFLVFFNPNRSIRVKEFSFLNIERDLNVTLTGITPTVTLDIAENDRRIVACDIGINVNGFLYRPIERQKIIKTIQSKYYTIEDINDI